MHSRHTVPAPSNASTSASRFGLFDIHAQANALGQRSALTPVGRMTRVLAGLWLLSVSTAAQATLVSSNVSTNPNYANIQFDFYTKYTARLAPDGLTAFVTATSNNRVQIAAETRTAIGQPFTTPSFIPELLAPNTSRMCITVTDGGRRMFFYDFDSTAGAEHWYVMETTRSSQAAQWGPAQQVWVFPAPSARFASFVTYFSNHVGTAPDDGLELFITLDPTCCTCQTAPYVLRRSSPGSPFTSFGQVTEFPSCGGYLDHVQALLCSPDGLTMLYSTGTSATMLFLRASRASAFVSTSSQIVTPGLNCMTVMSGTSDWRELLVWSQFSCLTPGYKLGRTTVNGLVNTGHLSSTSSADLVYRDLSAAPGTAAGGAIAWGFTPGTTSGGSTWPLTNDALFQQTYLTNLPGLTAGFLTALDSLGEAHAAVGPLPPQTEGDTFYCAFATLNASSPSASVVRMSNAIAIRMQPASAAAQVQHPCATGTGCTAPPVGPGPYGVQYGPPVVLPQGPLSFADAVHAPVQEGTYYSAASTFCNPCDALGAPDYDSGDPLQPGPGTGHVATQQHGAYSLGHRGSIELAFTDNALTNSGSSQPDLYVWEAGNHAEDFFVALHPADAYTTTVMAGTPPGLDTDGNFPLPLVTGPSFVHGIDIDQSLPGFSAGSLRFDRVKLKDSPGCPLPPCEPPTTSETQAGADIDAVAAVGFPPVSGPPPFVSLVTPSCGSTVGGTTITINGASFTVPGAVAAPTVAIGGFPAQVVSFTSTQIVAVTPPSLQIGNAVVTVTAPTGIATASAPFVYTAQPAISSVTLGQSCPVVGQPTAITITGTGFLPTCTTAFVNGSPIVGTSSGGPNITSTTLTGQFTAATAGPITISLLNPGWPVAQFGVPGFAANASDVVLTQPVTIDASNLGVFTNASVIVCNTTLTIATPTTLQSIALVAGSTLTHPAGITGGATVTVSGNAYIDAGSAVDVSGRGALSAASGSTGGSHGGLGGLAATNAAHGSIVAPMDCSAGGRGGGALQLIVTGTLTHNEVIRSNGANGTACNAGGGSGGSLWIQAASLTGLGTITANGGSGSGGVGGGGSGGRIAVISPANTSAFTYAVSGGAGLGGRGGAGTIYTQFNGATLGDLVVDNGGNAGNRTILNGTVTQFANVLVKGAATLSHEFAVSGLFLDVPGTIIVEAGAAIDASGYGNTGGGITAGGSHGGQGGGASGAVHGSIANPTDFGTGRHGLQRRRPRRWSPPPAFSLGPHHHQRRRPRQRVQRDGMQRRWWIRRHLDRNASPHGCRCHHPTAETVTAVAAAAVAAAASRCSRRSRSRRRVDCVRWNGVQKGGAGTIYTLIGAATIGDLVVDNGGTTVGNMTDVNVDGVINVFQNVAVHGGGVLMLSGTPVFASLVVDTSGIVTHLVGPASGLTLQVLGPATIASSGSVDVSGRGALSAASGSTGGSHGGLGGLAATNAAHGSIVAPVDLGSGGGMDCSAGGRGGGALQLIVTGTLTHNGVIRSNGANGTACNAGGGSGGSLWIQAASLTGLGTITANGGSGSGGGGGGGSGGRIAVISPANTSAFTYVVSGGAGVAGRGGAGTIYTQFNGATLGDLVVDNGGNAGNRTILSGTVTQFANVLVKGAATLSHEFAVSGLFLDVPGTIIVEAGAAIDASGYGNTGGGNITAGGSHGGQGGGASGAVHGSIANPTDFGTGGGMDCNAGGRGGGAIHLRSALGSITINGAVRANGFNATGCNAGGGSGGSIWIETPLLAGTGAITCNGGNGSGGNGNGGGGGRIAVFSPIPISGVALTAFGGNGVQKGGAGTIYTLIGAATIGDLVVDNGGTTVGNMTDVNVDGVINVFQNVAVHGGGVLMLSGTPVFASLVVDTSGIVTHLVGPASGLTLQVLGPMTIASSGSVDVSGRGALSAASGSTGGSHGGLGGLAATNAAHGSIVAPVDLGSGGGSGGSLWIQAASLTGLGTITANGGSGSGGVGGGGSGGRIAVISPANTSAFTYAVSGGAGLGGRGGAGTIYTQFNGATLGDLVVDNGGNAGNRTILSGTVTQFANVLVKGAATLSHEFAVSGLFLDVPGTIIVEAGAAIDASGYGNTGGGNITAGGSHGGQGGGASGAVHGSIANPTDFGTGGGMDCNAGGRGGGALHLRSASGLITINGAVRANGFNATGCNAGGGSGGSIWIETPLLTGAGAITSNGGNGNGGGGCGGGGGRIAVFSPVPISGVALTAFGGNGVQRGGAGTIDVVLAGQHGTFVVDNGGSSGNVTPITGPVTFDADLIVTGGATLQIPSGTLTYLGNAVLGTGQLSGSGTLDVDGSVTCNGMALASTPPSIRCGGNWTADASFAPTGGTIELDGAAPSTIGASTSGGVVKFFNLVIRNGVRGAMNSPVVSASSILVDASGTIDVGTGQALTINRAPAPTTVTIDGVLSVGTAQLLLGPTTALSVTAAGTLRLLGSPSTRATVAGTAGGGFGLTVNGTIAARNFAVRDVNSSGVVIPATATIAPFPNDFRGGTFDLRAGATAGSTLLDIQRPAPTTLAYLDFRNTPGAAGVTNVRCTSGAPITLNNWTGPFGGSAFESDPGNRVTWNAEQHTTLASFRARGLAEKADIVWTTSVEVDVAAFIVERASTSLGPWMTIASFSPAGPSFYGMTDAGLTAGQTYYYRLSERLTHDPVNELATGQATPYSSAPPANVFKVGAGGPYATIQSAISAATAPTSIVWVTPGTYPAFIVDGSAPPNLKVIGGGSGPVIIDTTAAAVLISGVPAGRTVEIAALSIGSTTSGHDAVDIVGCGGAIVLDALTVIGGSGMRGIDVAASTGVAIQRSQMSGTPGLRLAGGSNVAASRGSLDALAVITGSSLQVTDLVPGAVTVDGTQTLVANAGLMPDLNLPRFPSLGAYESFDLTTFPNSVVLIGISTGAGFIGGLAPIQMPFLLDPASLAILPILAADATGHLGFGFELEPNVALLGLTFEVQVTSQDPSTGVIRFSNLATMVGLP